MIQPQKDSVDVGILVRDINASLKFYQDMLGLSFVEKRAASSGTMYRLRFGTSDIKLITPDVLPSKGPLGIKNQLGFRYVTFSVQNLSKLCSFLMKNGVEFELGEKEIRPGVRIAMVRDPDDNIVEFVERR